MHSLLFPGSPYESLVNTAWLVRSRMLVHYSVMASYDCIACSFVVGDSQCNEARATGMIIEWLARDEVDVVFGPACGLSE